ncbi:hypothetical protein H109_04247 [Trichophyton interdigitale MR816]|uniref:Uncharacterized protein n=1 Tax=Trichophyton interdigitale (strain MR816) TaxID=1215338 RepID=A0A059J7P3_TRIIM|nr:hypothetical protein H101_04403 [Trichophyton interdigitale H6]KDB23865.1 hypothetical protein H109_04247 [Trichophyton interdigitale MR816]
MSAALPYLRALRKSDLVSLAELSDMKDFADMKKTELEAALDAHLSQNKNRLASESKLSDYYERLARPPRGSPIKKEPKVEVTSFDGSSSVKRSTRRRSVKPKEEVEATDDSDESSTKSSPAPEQAPVATQTPSRPAIKFPSLPPSPAVVTDAIDRQTTRVRKSVSEAWDQSGMTERTHSLRSLLSSTSTIQILVLILELSSVINAIMPWRKFTFPAIEALNTSACTHNIPDLFNTFQPAFWSPLLLWTTTSVVLPSIIAYFFDINLKMSQSTSPTTRRSAVATAAQDKGKVCGDPLVFNVAKALIASIVYGSGFNFWNLFSQTSVLKVVSAVPWGLQGLLTGSAICTLGSLYEAILRK